MADVDIEAWLEAPYQKKEAPKVDFRTCFGLYFLLWVFLPVSFDAASHTVVFRRGRVLVNSLAALFILGLHLRRQTQPIPLAHNAGSKA